MAHAMTHIFLGLVIATSFFLGCWVVDLDHLHSWEGAKSLWERFWTSREPKDLAEEKLTHRGIFHSWKTWLVITSFVLGWGFHLLIDRLVDLKVMAP